jgi:Ran GTPase-activating protein (RanGAP) involved in mRNA processing and transport
LATALRKNTTLKSLNIFFNLIGFDGAKEFGQTLKVNNTLEFLDLGDNRIRNKGLLAIADGLS